jgi:hypothetical protein
MATRDAADTNPAIVFLDHHAAYGGRSHLETALALSIALDTIIDDDVKTMLAVKVYAEFISSLEDFGALCVAVHHRESIQGIIRSYLRYDQHRVKPAPSICVSGIFKLALPPDRIQTALRLPQLADVLAQTPKAIHDNVIRAYQETDRLLLEVAKTYLFDGQAYIRAYNKAKHGFVVDRDTRWLHPDGSAISPGETWIIAERASERDSGPSTPQSSTPPVRQPSLELLSVKVTDVRPLILRINTVGTAVVVVCELVTTLLRHGVLHCTDGSVGIQSAAEDVD